MSLPAPYSEVYQAGDGVTTVFSFGDNFVPISQDLVKCIIYLEDGYEVIPVYDVDIDVGTVTITTLTTPQGVVLTAPPIGSTVRIYRDEPEAQNVTASQLQAFTAKQLERALDAIVAMIQEVSYTTDHKTIRLTEPQRDIALQELGGLEDGHLIYWDNTARKLVVTNYPQQDVVRCVNGLFFRLRANPGTNTPYLQWSTDNSDWHSIDVDSAYALANDAYTLADSAYNLASTTRGELNAHKADHANPHETSMTNLIDTDFNNLVSGQFLQFDGIKWKNVNYTAVYAWGGILGDIDDQADLKIALDGKVEKAGDTMTGALNIADIASSNTPLVTLTHSNTTTYKWNIAPRYNSTTLSIYPGSTETNGYRFATTGFVPASNNARYLGSASLKWKGIYVGVINNGADLTVPNKTGTLATMGDVELAARSGRMITDQGVWYAKMYAATVAPAAEDGTNYADFSQVDGQGNPIIVTYNRVNGAWVQDQTITPPAEYDGYVLVTSKIWDIAEQTGQQGGRVLWNHTSKEFTPYPQIISFEDIGITGNSTVVMPQNPGANQIVNKDYVDEAIAAIPTPTVDVLLSPDIDIVGTLTQNGSVFSGFSSGNYLRSRWSPVDFREPFEFVIGANFTAGTLNQQIASHGPTSYGGTFTLLYSGSTGELKFVGGGGGIQISGAVSTGVDYLIKVTWDGTDYKMFVSTDNGATYSQVGSTYTSTTNCGYGTYLRIGKDGGTQFYESFLGTINLSGAYLKIGENIVWAGMDAPGLQQRVMKGHEVIEFQAPTAQNNYTWYRKYADGWVEQGGTMSAQTRGERTPAQVNLPIAMSDNNYYVNCQKVGTNDGASIAIQVVDRDSTYFNWCVTYGSSALDRTIVWEVCGMAA